MKKSSLVMILALVGCQSGKQVTPPKIEPLKDSNQTWNSIAPADSAAYRYVLNHGCAVWRRSEAGPSSVFDYKTGQPEQVPARTYYQCHSPEVMVLVDDGNGGSK